MKSLEDIFVGVAAQPTRDYVAIEMVRTGREHVYMPCAGRFGAIQAYLGHEGMPARVQASDICLFSSIIGYVADQSKDIADLRLTFSGGIPEPDRTNEMDVAATGMMAVKLSQVASLGVSLYSENVRRELLDRFDAHKEKVSEQLSKMTERLHGIRYDVEDMWSVLGRAAEDEADGGGWWRSRPR